MCGRERERILVRKCGGQRPLGRPGHRWENTSWYILKLSVFVTFLFENFI
jgi:hypothetical protein